MPKSAAKPAVVPDRAAARPREYAFFDDTPASVRRLALLLYALVAPPFALALHFLAAPPYRVLAPLAVLALCVIGGLSMAVTARPTRLTGSVAIIAPTLCCALAFAATEPHAVVFAGAMMAPLAWAAMLFGNVEAVAAVITGTLASAAIGAQQGGAVAALFDGAVYAIIASLVAVVIAGKTVSRRQARLAVLERQVNDVELVVEPSGRIVAANDRAVTTYGYSHDELAGMDVRNLRLPDEAGVVDVQLGRANARGGHFFEARHVRKDGTSFDVEVSSRPFEVEGRKLLHSLIRDITARRRLEGERDASLARAESATRLREQVMAVVAHDLRSPLAAIELSTARMEQMAAEGDVAGLADRIALVRSAASRTKSLVDDLLDLAAMQAGQLRVSLGEVDAVSTAREAGRLCAEEARTRGVRLVVETRVLPSVRADRDRLLQILGNLLGNALAVTPESGTVIVSLDGDEQRATFAVSDSGPGIAPEVAAHLFDPWVRGEASRHKGAGLGLAICRGLVEAHGGTLEVGAAEGGGARFRFSVPLAEPSAASSA